MIDLICIFTAGGLILWYKAFVSDNFENAMNKLIKDILLDQKRNQDSLYEKGRVLKWKVNNETGIIFLVGFREEYGVLYVEQLLDFVSKDFMSHSFVKINKIGKLFLESFEYEENFKEILRKWENFCKEKLEYIFFK